MVKEITVKEIDKKRYDAFAMFSRSPATEHFSKELSWYSNEEETIIGTVLLDIVDFDYGAVVSARDENGMFRAFDLEVSIPNEEAAKSWIMNTIRWHTSQNIRVVPQGSDTPGIDLFTPKVLPERFHPFFASLSGDEAHTPARAIIKEMMPHYVDIDGNFVEQFQTTGFDARLWELYLFAYLTEEQLFIERKQSSPDFMVMKYGEKVAIEAVIVGRKKDNPPLLLAQKPKLMTPEQVLEATRDSMPIMFASSLDRKLKKQYWKLPHVKGNPLVFAIADFHDTRSTLWSSTALLITCMGLDMRSPAMNLTSFRSNH
jgi:hypothetical protein